MVKNQNLKLFIIKSAMQNKKQKRQHQIALYAYEQLVQNGVDAFSLNAFLEDMGMSKGNFYHYFSSKDKLFCEAIKLAYEEIASTCSSSLTHEELEEQLLGLYFMYSIKDDRIEAYLKVINEMYSLFSNPKNKYLYAYMQEVYGYLFYELNRIIQEAVNESKVHESMLKMVKPIAATADGMLTHFEMLEEYDLQKEFTSYIQFLCQTYQR